MIMVLIGILINNARILDLPSRMRSLENRLTSLETKFGATDFPPGDNLGCL